MSGCRIGKIKMKNGGAEIVVHPSTNDSVGRVSFTWGEITFRMYDDPDKLLPRDMLWMLRAAEQSILKGEIEWI